MAHALFTTCVFLLFIFYSAQNSNAQEGELSELRIFGIEKFCASHNHHILKTSKLICLICKGFDMSCLLKPTTPATTSSTDTPTTSSTTTTSTTTSTSTTTTPKSTDTTTTPKSTETTTSK